MNANSIYSGLKIILGVLLIIVGTAGLFLPFLQGFLMITAGLVLIFGKSILKKLKKLKDYLVTRFKNK